MAPNYVYAPETIIKAYALGLFPMAESHNSKEIRFYDPAMRGLIPLDNSLGTGLHIPRRLRRRARADALRAELPEPGLLLQPGAGTPKLKKLQRH